ncbi:MAG: hypothetical protein KAV00_03855 [Phycisphaerae bacterium]|nr:hypothetical protein [Phycisphaerae bacterium]
MIPTNNTRDCNEEAPQGKALLLSNLATLVQHSAMEWTPQNIARIADALERALGETSNTTADVEGSPANDRRFLSQLVRRAAGDP